MKIYISGNGGDERFNVKHNPETNMLTLEVTEKVEGFIIEHFKEMFPLQLSKATVEVCDVINDSGRLYKNVRRYSMYCDDIDKIDALFEAALISYRDHTKTNLN